jgi:hypothetical protein
MESSAFPFMLRVIIVFRDIIYVIIILYLCHLIICEHIWPYVLNNRSWVMHTVSTWFGVKIGYDTSGCQSDKRWLEHLGHLSY